ncbi:hypothetical protein PMI10_04088 [Flavobacterium sp. CF136]|jgi:hypothetical protein|nr:hypothetical protein PMI10_04088 [Flavobacterium sp. CF136]
MDLIKNKKTEKLKKKEILEVERLRIKKVHNF